MLTVVGTPEPKSSTSDEAFRHEQLVQIHSLLTLLTPTASDSTPHHDSTFKGLEECIDALLRSLDSVPIPPPTPSLSREHEGRMEGERNTGGEPNTSQGGQLPPLSITSVIQRPLSRVGPSQSIYTYQYDSVYSSYLRES
jgi:hypothetical protein